MSDGDLYDEKYFSSCSCGTYIGKEHRFHRIAKETIGLLDRLSLKHYKVLDFGCAFGFLMTGLQPYCEKIYGVDISDYAIKIANHRGLSVDKKIDFDEDYDVVYALDVLEHMNPNEVADTLNKIKSNVIIFRVPICAKSGQNYVQEKARKDKTHRIVWTREEWSTFFAAYGYECVELDLFTMYNSEGVYSAMAINYENLNG